MNIVSLMLEEVNGLLAKQKLHIEVPTEVKEKLVDLGYDPAMGARPLRRTIQEQIEDGIAEYYLDHPENHQLVAALDNEGKIIVTGAQEVTKTETSTSDQENNQNPHALITMRADFYAFHFLFSSKTIIEERYSYTCSS